MIDVLVQVLDALDARTNLDVGVTVEFFAQPGVIGHNPTIVELHLPNRHSASVIPPAILRIPVDVGSCDLAEFLWVVFGTLAVLHADAVRV